MKCIFLEIFQPLVQTAQVLFTPWLMIKLFGWKVKYLHNCLSSNVTDVLYQLSFCHISKQMQSLLTFNKNN